MKIPNTVREKIGEVYSCLYQTPDLHAILAASKALARQTEIEIRKAKSKEMVE